MTMAVQIPPGLSTVHLVAAARKLKARPRTVPFQRTHLYPKQAAIIDDPARFTATEASPKVGKSMSHLEWLLECGANEGEGEWWWVAPSNKQAKMMMRRAKLRLRGLLPKPGEDGKLKVTRIADPIPFKANESEQWIESMGARWWFLTAEKPDTLYGEDVRGLVGDEFTRWREEAYNAVYTTLVSTGGRAKYISNVKGRKSFAYRLARKAEAGEPDWGYHRLTAMDGVDGGVISQSIVDAAKRDLPDAVFRELFLAEPSDDAGNPFGIDAITACTRNTLATGPAVAWGWDLAKSVDWTVGIALNRLGHVCEFHRFQRSWDDTEREIVRLSGHANGLVDSTGVGDPIMERLARKTRLEGMKYTSASKQQLMEGLAVALQNGEIQFPDGPIRHELEAFEYEYTRTGVRYSAPDGMHDDCVCALAQAVRAFVSMPRAFAPSEEELAAVTADAEDWRAEVAW